MEAAAASWVAGNGERHGDRGIQQMLDFGGAFRGQPISRAVDMGLERHAVGIELAQAGQRHDLKPARIGQDRARPIHEPVQPSERRDPLGARPEHQVIGIAEHHGGTGGAHRVRRHRLHRAGGANRHEHRRRHIAVRGAQRAGAGGAIRCMQGELHARCSSVASP
jgi:hypothetical protein